MATGSIFHPLLPLLAARTALALTPDSVNPLYTPHIAKVLILYTQVHSQKGALL
jgi:hypothetical protein